MLFPEQSIPVMSDMEFRAVGDGNTFVGYAALFDTPSDNPALGFTEIIRPGTFKRALGSKRHHDFVLNHDDNQLIASTYSKRLQITEDEKGLLVTATLSNTAASQELRALHDAGELRGMSFTFKPTRDGMKRSAAGRELTDVALGHVTAVSTMDPAYSQTAETVQFRALADELSADPEDLGGLFDALRGGAPLVDDQISLLHRLAQRYQLAASPPEQQPESRSLDAWKALLSEKGIDLSPDGQTGAPTGAA